MWRAFSSSRILLANSLTESREDTSTRRKWTSKFPVFSLISLSAAVPRASFLQARITRAPRRAKSRAMNFPIPSRVEESNKEFALLDNKNGHIDNNQQVAFWSGEKINALKTANADLLNVEACGIVTQKQKPVVLGKHDLIQEWVKRTSFTQTAGLTLSKKTWHTCDSPLAYLVVPCLLFSCRFM